MADAKRPLEDLNGLHHLAERLVYGLASFQAHHGRKILATFNAHELEETGHDAAALHRGLRDPAGQSTIGRTNRFVDRACIARRVAGDHDADICRTVSGDGQAVGNLPAPAVDDVVSMIRCHGTLLVDPSVDRTGRA